MKLLEALFSITITRYFALASWLATYIMLLPVSLSTTSLSDRGTIECLNTNLITANLAENCLIATPLYLVCIALYYSLFSLYWDHLVLDRQKRRYHGEKLNYF